MLSPQSLNFSSISFCEEELPKALETSLNPKEVMKVLKIFSYVGQLQSKINLLFSAITLSVLLPGFRIKWSEQTGFKSTSLRESTAGLIQQTSLGLQKMVLDASLIQFESTLNTLFGFQSSMPNLYWSKGMKNYQYILNTSSSKHLKKLRKIVPDANMKSFYPYLNLSSKPNLENLRPPSSMAPSLPTEFQDENYLICTFC